MNRARTLLRAAPMALIARVELANFDLFLCTEGSFFQRDLHIVTQIRAALPLVSATATAATEKTLENSTAATAESLAENIEGIVKSAAKPLAALSESGMPIPVVGRAFVSVDQDIVGLAQLLEFLLGMGVLRIFVGMKLDSQLAIGALDFVVMRAPVNSEHFVIIAFGCRHLW